MTLKIFPFDEDWTPPEPVDSRTLTPSRPSMLYWLPKLEAAGDLPMPRTKMVRFDNRTIWPLVDNEPIDKFDLGPHLDSANEIGTPCFVKSDVSSAKHDGPSSYCLEHPGRLLDILCRTFYDNCLKDLDVLAFCFREWIDIEATFRAFGGHPIGVEWRIFATSQGVLCRHFYWPTEALREHVDGEHDWERKLAELERSTSEDELRAIGELAVRAVRALGEEPERCWSVDFARDNHRKWWLIDIAPAERSWHPKHKESLK